MAPPYLTSPRRYHQLSIEEILRFPHKTRRRPGPQPKPISEKPRTMINLTATTRKPLAQDIHREANTIQLFNDNRNNYNRLIETPERSENKNKPQRRLSYTREIKLAAVTYCLTTYVPDKKNRGTKLISVYAAGKTLGIDPSQLRKWMKNVNLIENIKKGNRKHQTTQKIQEEEMEIRLYNLFLQKRNEGRRINRKWFMRNARTFYEKLHPEKVTLNVQKRKEYNGFQFSNGWFNGFKKRFNITLRAGTKKAQKLLTDYEEKIVNWLRYNRRQMTDYEKKYYGRIARSHDLGR